MSQTFGASRFDAIVDRSITEIKSNVKTIGQYAFYGCTNLITAAFPKATSVEGYAFNGCTNLTTIDMPNLSNENLTTHTDSNIFAGCTSLTRVYLPKLGRAHNYAFQNCTSLQAIALPSWRGANSHVFAGCTNLTFVDYGGPNVTPSSMATAEFMNCSNLNTIIFRYNTVKYLGNVDMFAGTPFISGGAGGTIYIPKVLYDHLGDGTSLDYKANANWAALTITWAQIEGSQYENYFADGTPIT